MQTILCMHAYINRNCPPFEEVIILHADLDSCLFAPCETGAVCINLMGNDSYTCLCPPGFEGNNCGENINDCAPVNPCVNGGTCIVSASSIVSASRNPNLACLDTLYGILFLFTCMALVWESTMDA